MEHFYDKQIRRYIQQIIRIFSEFKVQINWTPDGDPVLRTVPALYGDPSRMTAHVIKKNSENMINTVPFISVYITDFQMVPERRTYQQHVMNAFATEKEFDHETGQYTDKPGNRYTIERHNPVPYDLTVTVDVWTSNTNQKMELLEQILVLFNPHINLRVNDSPFDWSNLTYMEMMNMQWTGRSVPSGADDVIDIATLQFKVPIYLNPPVKVKRQTLIHTIINRINVVNDDNLKLFDANKPFETQFESFVIVTLENFRLNFSGDRVNLVSSTGSLTDNDGNPLEWEPIIDHYGRLNPGYSQIRLRRTDNIEDDSEDIIGTLDWDENDPTRLIVDIDSDTLPANTLGTVDTIVNPQENYPGDGTLPAAVTGQRYLFTGASGTLTNWNLAANNGDIVVFNGTDWTIFFNSQTAPVGQTVFDNDSQVQYEWTGTNWVKNYEGIYNPGYWRLYL